MEDKLLQQLLGGLQQMGLTVSEHQASQLIAYVQLFDKWNQAFNLSAIRDPRQMVDRHLLDSLSVAPYIEAERIVDVGTGGGLPGIPLAIFFPQKRFTLLDSNGKKTRFLFQVKTRLGLDNVSIEHTRVEAWQPQPLFEAVISRAFASLGDMLAGCQHLLQPDGVYYAMKGIYPHDELREVGKHYKVLASHTLQVPREDGQRHLLVLSS